MNTKTILTYDIKNEQDYLMCGEDNSIQKFYTYKTTDDSFDCDFSFFAIEQAKKLYPFLEKFNIRKQPYCTKKYELYSEDTSMVFRGDTCNSFQTMYRIAVKQLKNYWNICNQYDDKEYLNNLLATYQSISKDFEIELPHNLGKLFNEFSKITHTIPNMILLPTGLNSTRYPLTCDNFSLYLYAVCKYMNEEQDFYLRKIYGKSTDLALQYLQTFKTWTNYVKANFLESYLDEDYLPREFIKGQFENFRNLLNELGTIPIEEYDRKKFFGNKTNRDKIEKATCPKDHDEFIEYLTSMISAIGKRRTQMSELLSR